MFSAAAMLTGVVVLLGWTWDIDLLKRILPGLVSMNPLTAVLFFLAGLSLWLQRQPLRLTEAPAPAASKTGRRVAYVCAGLVFCGGIVKLASYVGGWKSGVDQVMFTEKLLRDQPSLPNQMAPNAAFSFVLTGASLLLLDLRSTRRRWSPEYFTVLILLTSLLALMGYVYRIPVLYEVGAFIPMALHTAVVFQLLALGILFARPERGLMSVMMSDGPGGALARVLLPSLVAAQFVLGWLRMEGERRGLYGMEMGVALYTVANITIAAALVWWNVRSLHRVDEVRKRAEAQANRFFNLSLDMLCIAGNDGFFRRLSPAFNHTLGYSTDELLARPFLDFVHPDDRPATLKEMEKLALGAPTVQFENRYHCQDGTWKWLSWTTQPFPSEGLQYATARDVTEKKQREAAIHELNEQLQLRAQQLEAANNELESFSYSVSHDLRAPLRHVQGYVEMLSNATRGTLEEKPQRYLRTITEASSEMGHLIDDLLAFSRMGRTEMRQSPVDLNGLITDTIRDQEMALRERKVNWIIAVLPAVHGDAVMLKQALANLIGNAVKYSRGREVAEIEIGRQGEDEDGKVIFFVRDNGAGFDMRYVQKLFGVFQRLHRSDEFEGTGIGLAIVRRIIARHGGRTWAEGVLHQGATFYFTLQPMPLV